MLTSRSIVVDHLLPFTNNLNHDKIGVLAVYFQYDSRNLQTSENIARSLCRQILCQLDIIPASLEAAYRRFKEGNMSAQPDINFFFSLLADCVGQYSSVFLMLDAFDECSDSQIPTILKLLQKLLECQLRIFVTGRPHILDSPHIREDDESQQWLRERSTLVIIASPSDIAIYLKGKLDRTKRIEETIKRKILSIVSTKADGQ
jgi:hypothetical protein